MEQQLDVQHPHRSRTPGEHCSGKGTGSRGQSRWGRAQLADMKLLETVYLIHRTRLREAIVLEDHHPAANERFLGLDAQECLERRAYQ